MVTEHAYEYDLNGNRALDTSRRMDADNHGTYLQRVATFTYDPRDRLATVTRTDPSTGQQVGTESYTHDANNNIISQTINATTTTSTYDRNRLQSTEVGGVVSGYNYDPFGRLDTVTTAGQVTARYLYDGFDRIVEQHTDAAVTRKTYDPLDRTATKTTNAETAEQETTEFVYLGLSEQVLAEIVDGQVATTYQHGVTGQLLSQTKHDQAGGQEDSFYGYNPHGDVAAITDQTGNTRATYGYTAYGTDDQSLFTGVDRPDPGNPEDQDPYNAYRYAGKRFDQTTGTYDMGFRDYDPGLNRFLTRDTYNGALADLSLTTSPWTMSRYTFAGGNPTTLVEHDGHRPTCTPDGYNFCPNYSIKDQPQAPTEPSTPAIGPADPYQVYFYELPEGGPNAADLAKYIEEWLGLPHVPSPVNGMGPTTQHSDPRVATSQIVAAYCATWHTRGDTPVCSEQFHDEVLQDLKGAEQHPFVSLSACEGVCGTFTVADGKLWFSLGLGCCGTGVTVGNTDVPASYQEEQSWNACASFFVGPCEMWGRTTPDYPYGQYRGDRWSGSGVTFGIKAGVQAGPVRTYELVQLW